MQAKGRTCLGGGLPAGRVTEDDSIVAVGLEGVGEGQDADLLEALEHVGDDGAILSIL